MFTDAQLGILRHGGDCADALDAFRLDKRHGTSNLSLYRMRIVSMLMSGTGALSDHLLLPLSLANFVLSAFFLPRF